MKLRISYTFLSALILTGGMLTYGQDRRLSSETPLPSSKLLLPSIPGSPQTTNSFPVAMALSPDGRYLAVLNNGYGTAESGFKQSIAVIDTKTNRLTDYPESRLTGRSHQTYFLGLGFSPDGHSLFASMGLE